MKTLLLHFAKILLMTLVINLTATGLSHADKNDVITNRCAYIYGAVTVRMSMVLAGLLNSLNAYEEVTRAHEAAQLALNLDCPKEPMVASVDCGVALVMEQKGRPIAIKDGISCVEQSTGQSFPSLLEDAN